MRLVLGEWADAAEDGDSVTGAGAGARSGVLYRLPGAVSVARLLPCGDDTASGSPSARWRTWAERCGGCTGSRGSSLSGHRTLA